MTVREPSNYDLPFDRGCILARIYPREDKCKKTGLARDNGLYWERGVRRRDKTIGSVEEISEKLDKKHKALWSVINIIVK